MRTLSVFLANVERSLSYLKFRTKSSFTYHIFFIIFFGATLISVKERNNRNTTGTTVASKKIIKNI